MENAFYDTKGVNMKLTPESKVLLAIVGITVLVIGLAAVVLTKPAPTYTKNDMVPAYAHVKGDPKAKVYLVEFSDFECPACGAVQPTVNALTNQYKDKLLYVYRHFPLSIHPFAQKAAEVSEAANAQGKFWEMHDLLFANQAKLSDQEFSDLAKQLNLDMTKFDADIKNGAYTNRVLDDESAGNTFGINATPTFFLNGKKLDITSYEDLKTAVDEAVKK